jgi:hypothetical protein
MPSPDKTGLLLATQGLHSSSQPSEQQASPQEVQNVFMFKPFLFPEVKPCHCSLATNKRNDYFLAE